MSSENKKEFLDRLIEMYAKAGYPVAVLDKQFYIVWCSDTAKLSFPALSLPDGAHSLLSGYDFELVRQEIAAKGVYSTIEKVEFWGDPSITICALPTDDDELYLMELPPVSPQGTGMQPQGISRLLSSLNSQYRSPLSIIFSTLSVLVQDARQNRSGAELSNLLAHYEAINQNAYRVLRNCELLTMYTQLTSGLSPMRLVRLELFSFLRSLFGVCAEMTAQSGIELCYDVPDGILVLVCDESKLVCAIMCVLSNSCRFTRDGNQIDIRVRQLENSVSISISDHGVGIPPHVQPHVFEPHFSFSKDGGPFSGNGLGLSIAKQAVCALGGTIALSSVENEGTTVLFTLPITDNHLAPPAVHSDAADYLNDRFSMPWIYLSDSIRCPLW